MPMNWFKSIRKLLAKWKAQAAVPKADAAMLSNFTPRAYQVLGLARQEAKRLNHNILGTEHLLLGLIKLGNGVAVNVLKKLGVDLETARIKVEQLDSTGPDRNKTLVNIPFTPRLKRVIALAQQEAKSLNHTYVGTEHLLLGILAEGNGVAAMALRHSKVDLEKTRKEILEEITPKFP